MAEIRYLKSVRRSMVQGNLRLLVKAGCMLLILLPITGAFLYVHRFGINFPYSDQWVEVDLFGKLAAGTLGMDDLFAQRNEHRLFFPRLVILSLAALTHYNTVAEMYFIQVCAVATLAVFWFAFRGGANKLLLFVPVAVLLFSLRQHVSMLLGIQIVVALTQLCAVLAFYCLHRSRRDGGEKMAFPVAILSATVASFSFLQGLFVWPAGLVQLVIMSVDRSKKRMMIAVWTVVGACEWALYFYSFANEGDRALGYFLIHPVKAVQYLLTLAGSTLFAHPSYALVAGVILLALAVGLVLWIYVDGALGDYSFWIAVLVFVTFFGLAAMVGRLEIGVQQATASRYVNLSILLPISVYAMLVQRAVDKGTAAAAVLVAGFVAMVIVSLPGAYMQAMAAGADAKQDREKLAFTLATYRSQPPEVVASLSPAFRIAKDEDEAAVLRVASSVEGTARLLDRLNYTVFAPGAQPAVPPKPGRLDAARGSTRGVVSRINQMRAIKNRGPVTVSADEVLVSVKGWAVDRKAEKAAGGVYVSVEGDLYPAYYGANSENVARKFGVPAYANVGFQADIPVSELEDGTNELSLIVLTSDRKAYYRNTGKAAIEVNK